MLLHQLFINLWDCVRLLWTHWACWRGDNASDMYLGSLWFEFRPVHWLPWPRVFLVSLRPSSTSLRPWLLPSKSSVFILYPQRVHSLGAKSAAKWAAIWRGNTVRRCPDLQSVGPHLNWIKLWERDSRPQYRSPWHLTSGLRFQTVSRRLSVWSCYSKRWGIRSRAGRNSDESIVQNPFLNNSHSLVCCVTYWPERSLPRNVSCHWTWDILECRPPLNMEHPGM
jgi:hypothetical protein